jgi:ATP-binding cassette subfamily B protein
LTPIVSATRTASCGCSLPTAWRLSGVLALIVLSSGLSMISPFLLRDVLDNALLHHNETLLTELVLGMIAIAIITSALSVVQTYISNDVGQRVMHDLRVSVYRHLQRLSLAFFTRTRAGEVQSRMPTTSVASTTSPPARRRRSPRTPRR